MRTILTLILSLLVLAIATDATERVVRYQTLRFQGPVSFTSGGNISSRNDGQLTGNVLNIADGSAQLAQYSFMVYTANEIDQKFKTASEVVQVEDGKIIQRVEALERKLIETETSIKRDVEKTINLLPNRALQDEVRNALKSAVAAELKLELAKFREEIQGEISALKASRGDK